MRRRVARHLTVHSILVAVPLVGARVLLLRLRLVRGMAAALSVVLLLVLHRLDALASVSDALPEFAEIQFLNVLRLLARLVGALQNGGARAIALTHVQTLVEQVLPPKLVLVHGRVGRFSRGRTVPGRACAAAAGVGHAPVSHVLRRHLALLEYVLLVVLVHDAHLLVVAARAAHSGGRGLRLVALLDVLCLRCALHLLHASGVAVLLRLRGHAMLATRADLLPALQINGAVEVLIEFHAEGVHAAGASHVTLLDVLQEATSSIALLRAYARPLRMLAVIFHAGGRLAHTTVLRLVVSDVDRLLVR